MNQAKWTSSSACLILRQQLSLRLQPIVMIPSVRTTAFEVYFVGLPPYLFDSGGTRELWLLPLRFKRLVRLVLFISCTSDCSFRAHLFSLSFLIFPAMTSLPSFRKSSCVDRVGIVHCVCQRCCNGGPTK